MFFGAPANPMPPNIATAISQAVAQVSGILEAHLPQCFVEGDKEARQVLVVVIRNRGDHPRIAEELMGKLRGALPAGQFIAILPLGSDSVPSGVREADCKIYPVERKPWWKVW